MPIEKSAWNAVVAGLEMQRAALTRQIEELRQLLGKRGPRKRRSSETAPSSGKDRRRRKKMSAEARARIAAAQKKRWAQVRAKSKEK
jgi:hypothetical protein